MIKVKVFLICLSVMIFIFSAIVSIEMYSLERAVARGIYQDLLDEMQDIGYLDEGTQEYYRNKMMEMKWEDEGDIFTGSWPRAVSQRAKKEKGESITLSLRIRPSKISQWMNSLIEGEYVFEFTGSRPSEYFDPGW